MSDEDKIKVITNAGWEEYYGSWIRTEWIKQLKPYDRMVVDLDHAYNWVINDQD